MNSNEKKMLKEIMIGYGFEFVPKELLDADSGCSQCNCKTKNLLVDIEIPKGNETVDIYRNKIDKLKSEAKCKTCVLYYYWDEELINSI